MVGSPELANRADARFTVELPRDERSVGMARRVVCEALERWQLATGDLASDAQLVVSELVTNALVHGHSAAVLTVELTPDGVTLAVTDASDAVPVPRTADDGAEGGRGLHLLDALCTCWDVEPLPAGGKRVWCRLDQH